MLKGLTKAELDKVDELVESLDISIAEAVDIIKADKEINQGKRVEFDLSAEDEKKAKKYANSTEKTKKAPPKRAEDAVKRSFISEIAQFLVENYKTAENIAVVNPERIISFEFDDEKYEIILQKKRKPKV